MARTVIVGDLHGCTAELGALLSAVGFRTAQDRLVFVGDLVARGPDPHGALEVARRTGAAAVRGNHEERLLAWRRRHGPLGAEHARIASALSEREWQQLEALPMWLDLPEHGVRVVHAGVVPDNDPSTTPAEALLRMRTLDGRGRWSDTPDAGPLWGESYEGPPHVIFGHNARREPQLHAWATGIDTGCVYGGRLTAVVLDEGQRMPRGEEARRVLRSVPAARAYHGTGGGPLAR